MTPGVRGTGERRADVGIRPSLPKHLAEFCRRSGRRKSNSFFERHVRDGKHFARRVRRMVRLRRTTEARSRANSLCRKSLGRMGIAHGSKENTDQTGKEAMEA